MQMKVIYILRVIFVSFEALLLTVAYLLWVQFLDEINIFTASLDVSQEIIKYLMFLPAAIATWVINECRLLLQDDKETVRILTLWDDYWRLKVHVWVSIFYALSFTLFSILPWVVKSGIGTGGGMLLFITSIVGQFILAISIYDARLSVKEFVVHVKTA